MVIVIPGVHSLAAMAGGVARVARVVFWSEWCWCSYNPGYIGE